MTERHAAAWSRTASRNDRQSLRARRDLCDGQSVIGPSRVALLACIGLWLGCADDKSGALEALAQSEREWEALEVESGDTYWYEEVNCALPPQLDGAGDSTRVQVIDGVVEAEVRETVSGLCAPGEIHRYGGFPSATFDELYEMCRSIVTSDHTVTVTYDDEGIVQLCRGEESNCDDSCDHGFYIAGRGFGVHD